MGGKAVQVPGKLDSKEPIEDVVRYLQNWFHAIVARTETHSHMIRLAKAASVPVINAKTDHNHPCEILADLTYIRAQRGSLDNLKVVFVGEPTNLCHPWFEAAARLPIEVTQVCPKGYAGYCQSLWTGDRERIPRCLLNSVGILSPDLLS